MRAVARLPSHRRGFTLFEVAISLALVSFGVVSVLMMFPAGIRAQQQSRYQILASVRAMEMVDIFSSATDASLMLDREGPYPWDTATSYHAYAPDLENRLGSFRFGLFPLPPDIARRLDSDGDEIQRILADGGYVYYSQPSATSGFNPVGARANMPAPNESQKILCAVTGYAQQNAIPALPYKDWPYHTPYPSPPVHVLNNQPNTSKPTSKWSVFDTSRGDKFMLWEDTLDEDVALVFKALVKGPDLPWTTRWVDAGGVGGILVGKYNHLGKAFNRSSGYWAYGDQGGWIPRFAPGSSNPSATPPNIQWRQDHADGGKRNDNPPYDIQPATLPHFSNSGSFPKAGDFANPVQGATQKQLARESALAYFALAKWYANKKGVSSRILDGEPLADDATLLGSVNLGTCRNPALAVNAARLLAHAAMCVTSHYLPSDAISENVGVLEVIREGSNLFNGTTPPFLLDRTIITNYVENAMKLGMRFAASFPYDWGSPRVLNRATMMDFPLLQYDTFHADLVEPGDYATFGAYDYGSRPAQGSRPAKAPQQWRVIPAQPIANLGRSMCYPSLDLPAIWNQAAVPAGTTPRHFTLARPFVAADRCRQLVFWAVDWQSYEDFETAPSAPVDASRYPKKSPHGNPVGANSARADLLMRSASFHDRHQYSARNPEKTLAFLVPTINEQTGAELLIGGNDSMWADDSRPDLGIDDPKHRNAPQVFSGRFGADRNFNGTRQDLDLANADVNRRNDIIKIYGKLDRGPVPRSVRMRAVQIGRFNFYDPRLPLVIR